MLDQLLEPACMEEYGRNGRRYAEKNHDIKKLVEQYKAIFSELAGSVT
jgi:hypothetical protein